VSALQTALVQYVEVRRALGSTLVEPASTLAQFVAFLEREGATRITTALALQWRWCHRASTERPGHAASPWCDASQHGCTHGIP
jgi:hypothetical protein